METDKQTLSKELLRRLENIQTFTWATDGYPIIDVEAIKARRFGGVTWRLTSDGHLILLQKTLKWHKPGCVTLDKPLSRAQFDQRLMEVLGDRDTFLMASNARCSPPPRSIKEFREWMNPMFFKDPLYDEKLILSEAYLRAREDAEDERKLQLMIVLKRLAEEREMASNSGKSSGNDTDTARDRIKTENTEIDLNDLN